MVRDRVFRLRRGTQWGTQSASCISTYFPADGILPYLLGRISDGGRIRCSTAANVYVQCSGAATYLVRSPLLCSTPVPCRVTNCSSLRMLFCFSPILLPPAWLPRESIRLRFLPRACRTSCPRTPLPILGPAAQERGVPIREFPSPLPKFPKLLWFRATSA